MTVKELRRVAGERNAGIPNDMLLPYTLEGTRTITPIIGSVPPVMHNMCFPGHRTYLLMLSPSGFG